MTDCVPVFLVCLCSTMIGAISGIGGGVIIKPMLDMLIAGQSMAAISMISSCGVLSMSLLSVLRNARAGEKRQRLRAFALPLAAGSTCGGVAGKLLFNLLKAWVNADAAVKTTQNLCLLAVMIAVFLLGLRKTERRETTPGTVPSLLVGLALGLVAAFLGIGGGPLNMAVLTLLFGLSHKEGALYSLFIIVFSQTAGIVTSLLTPGYDIPALSLIVTACCAGIGGSLIGRTLVKRMSDRAVVILYRAALVYIMAICVVNCVR